MELRKSLQAMNGSDEGESKVDGAGEEDESKVDDSSYGWLFKPDKVDIVPSEDEDGHDIDNSGESDWDERAGQRSYSDNEWEMQQTAAESTAEKADAAIALIRALPTAAVQKATLAKSAFRMSAGGASSGALWCSTV